MKYIPEPEWRFDEESYGGVYFTHKQRRIRRNHYLYRRKYHNTLDEKKTEKGVDCLLNYSRDWDDNGKVWRMKPNHNWASHGADAFRYLAVGYSLVDSNWDKPIRRKLKGIV